MGPPGGARADALPCGREGRRAIPQHPPRRPRPVPRLRRAEPRSRRSGTGPSIVGGRARRVGRSWPRPAPRRGRPGCAPGQSDRRRPARLPGRRLPARRPRRLRALQRGRHVDPARGQPPGGAALRGRGLRRPHPRGRRRHRPGGRRRGHQGRAPAAARPRRVAGARLHRGSPRGWRRRGPGPAACSSSCPGYEASFLARQHALLPPRPARPHREPRSRRRGLRDPRPGGGGRRARPWPRWSATVAAARLSDTARGAGEEPDRGHGSPGLDPGGGGDPRPRAPTARRSSRSWRALAVRAARRLRPFDLAAGALYGRGAAPRRHPAPQRDLPAAAVSSEDTLRTVAAGLAAPLLDEAVAGVRGIQVRLSRLGPIDAQAPLPLFPERRRFARTR